MPVIERDKTESPAEERFVREVPLPPEPKRSMRLVLLGGLFVALMIVVGIVFAAAGGDGASAPAPAACPLPRR